MPERVSNHPDARHERIRRTEAFIAQGWNNRRIADALRISERTVSRYRDELGMLIPKNVMSAEEIVLAEQMLDDGASLAEVARTIGRPVGTLSHRFRGRSQWNPTMAQHYRWARERLEAL